VLTKRCHAEETSVERRAWNHGFFHFNVPQTLLFSYPVLYSANSTACAHGLHICVLILPTLGHPLSFERSG
jgi:hypothetical protein